MILRTRRNIVALFLIIPDNTMSVHMNTFEKIIFKTPHRNIVPSLGIPPDPPTYCRPRHRRAKFFLLRFPDEAIAISEEISISATILRHTPVVAPGNIRNHSPILRLVVRSGAFTNCAPTLRLAVRSDIIEFRPPIMRQSHGQGPSKL